MSWFGTQKVKLHPNKPLTFLLYAITNEKSHIPWSQVPSITVSYELWYKVRQIQYTGIYLGTTPHGRASDPVKHLKVYRKASCQAESTTTARQLNGSTMSTYYWL